MRDKMSLTGAQVGSVLARNRIVISARSDFNELRSEVLSSFVSTFPSTHHHSSSRAQKKVP